MRNSGYSLIELIIVAGIAVVVLSGIGVVLNQTTQIQTQEQALSHIRLVQQTILQSLSSDQAWSNTVQAGSASGAKPASKMDCLKSGTPCTVDGSPGAAPIRNQPFALYDNSGNLVFDATNPLNGLTLQGSPCTVQSTAGSDSCPFRYELQWSASCAPGSCTNPQIKVSAQLISRFSSKTFVFNPASYSVSNLYLAKPPVLSANAGTLWSWGNNGTGSLGDGTTTDRRSPAQVGIKNTWTQIAGGHLQVHGIENGALWAWGQNGNGVLGDGTNVDRLLPTRIGTESNWAVVCSGNSHAAAVKNDGTLWGWGSGGDVGDGTNIPRWAPVQIGTDTDWATVSCNDSQTTAALKKDGSLWAWGPGPVGDGTGTNRNAPVRIGADSWKTVFCRHQRFLAIKSDGTLWAWGWAPALGNGINASNSPMQIGSDTDWVFVVVGHDQRVAIKSNGTMWIWGLRYLGDGTSSTSPTPIQVGTDTDWAKAALGFTGPYALALKTDGTLWAWGDNGNGQLGDGTVTTRLVPVRIGTENNWFDIDVGGHGPSFAIKK